MLNRLIIVICFFIVTGFTEAETLEAIDNNDNRISEVLSASLVLEDSDAPVEIEVVPFGFFIKQRLEKFRWPVEGGFAGTEILVEIRGFRDEAMSGTFFTQLIGSARRRQTGKERQMYDKADEQMVNLGLENSEVKNIRLKPYGDTRREIARFSPQINEERWCSWIILKYGSIVASLKPVRFKISRKADKKEILSEGSRELWYIPQRELMQAAVDLLLLIEKFSHKWNSIKKDSL